MLIVLVIIFLKKRANHFGKIIIRTIDRRYIPYRLYVKSYLMSVYNVYLKKVCVTYVYPIIWQQTVKMMIHEATFLSNVAWGLSHWELFPFPIENGQNRDTSVGSPLCLTCLSVDGNIAQQQCSKTYPLYQHLKCMVFSSAARQKGVDEETGLFGWMLYCSVERLHVVTH